MKKVPFEHVAVVIKQKNR